MPEASKFYDLCQSDRDGYYYKRNLYHMLTYGILLNLFSGLAFAPQLCPAAAWSILINLLSDPRLGGRPFRYKH